MSICSNLSLNVYLPILFIYLLLEICYMAMFTYLSLDLDL